MPFLGGYVSSLEGIIFQGLLAVVGKVIFIESKNGVYHCSHRGWSGLPSLEQGGIFLPDKSLVYPLRSNGLKG